MIRLVKDFRFQPKKKLTGNKAQKKMNSHCSDLILIIYMGKC